MRFVKVEACSNDFILLPPGSGPRGGALTALVPALCERRRGVGADGVLALDGSGRSYDVDVLNRDGTRAANCGNGLRGIGAWFADRAEGALTWEDEVAVRIRGGGAHRIRFGPDGPEVSMGHVRTVDPPEERMRGGGLVWGELENLHALTEWPRIPEAAELSQEVTRWRSVGLLEVANLHLVWREAPDRLVIRTHERGSGPTPACGSGACVAAQLFAPGEGSVSVRSVGGEVRVHDRAAEGVWLAGPARVVFKGEVTPAGA